MTFSVLDSLDRHARQDSDRAAIVEVDGRQIVRSLTRDQLMMHAAALATVIRRHVPSDAVVLIGSGNCMELPVALLATWLADRVAFAVSPDVADTELTRLAAIANVGGVIAAKARLDTPWFLPIGDVLRQVGTASGLDRCERRGALLLQSSGTTGMPRIVRRDMAALNAVADNCSQALNIGPHDRMLMSLPLHHSYGLEHGVLSCLASGATLEIHRAFDPHTVIHALQHHGVTMLPGVPFTFDMLGQHAPRGTVTTLRLAYSAGSALPPSVFESFAASFGLPLGQIYGATEFGSVTFNDPEALDFDPRSVGTPMAGVDVRILEANATDEGHVVVRAPSMLARYIDSGEQAIVDGYVHSGDLGRLDHHGRLHITGRLKLIIDVGGPKVNPLEVEAVLAQHPAVHEAVVVPAPITATVTRLRAIVTLRPGAAADASALRDFARARLSRHKVPRYVEIRPTLPRTGTGKVIRQALACS